MDLKSKIGSRIKVLRTGRKLTQEQLAQSMDRSHDTISELERGLTGAALDMLEELCAKLDYPVSELFDDVDGDDRSPEAHALIFEIVTMLKKLPPREVKRMRDQIKLATED